HLPAIPVEDHQLYVGLADIENRRGHELVHPFERKRAAVRCTRLPDRSDRTGKAGQKSKSPIFSLV
ncbi:MAG: hypothetical protein KDF64_20195, partial [Geminicoccaceae bacterium]|nr:hypothetical protein [Geminicoccaceae bacterium]